MPFAPTITHESKALPGVAFVVHRMGFARRTDLDFATLAFRQRLRELTADYPPPSDKEKELTEQLSIAQKKAAAVPAAEYDAVIEADVMPIATELVAAVPEDIRRQRSRLDMEYMLVDAMIRAEWIRKGLVSISGGEVEGLTADQLLDYGPPELAQEIYEALVADGKLRGADSRNLAEPTTSGAAVDGASPSSTAPSVAVPLVDGISSGTASGTFPLT